MAAGARLRVVDVADVAALFGAAFLGTARFVAGSELFTMVVLALAVLPSLSLPSESTCAVAFFTVDFLVVTAPCRLTAREAGQAFGGGAAFNGEAILLGSVREL